MGVYRLLHMRSYKSLQLLAFFMWAVATEGDFVYESSIGPASADAALANLTERVQRRQIHDAGSRPIRSESSDMFSYHKEFYPLNIQDLLCLVIAATCMMVAAGGGIGGGGILVPLYMIFLHFRPKHAVALSNFTILGGAFANTMINAPRTDSAGRSLIDWDIIVMMEPSTIGGTVVGSFASKYLSDFVLMVSLASVLSVLAFRTLDKGWAMFLREAEETEDQQDEASEDDTDRGEESRNLMGGAGPIRTVGGGTPWRKVMLLMCCFLGSSALTILKGSGRGSVIGVECGSGSFWVLSWATIPWVLAFGVIFRRMLIRENLVKQQDGHQFQTTEIRWDETNTIKYPMLCSLAGIFAGLFGVGGGIVKGPLMLEMGVNPQVAAATAATMILFTSSAASVSFEVFGLLEPTYGPACFMLGFACTLIGHYVIQVWMKAAKRQSPPVLSIGIVMAASTFLVLLEICGRLTHKGFQELMVPASLCNEAD